MNTAVCFGDSNTWGYDPAGGGRFPRFVRWPGVLQELLGDTWHIVEEGLCGRNASCEDPLTPFRGAASYILPCLESHAPADLVIIMLGTNDLKTRLCLSAQEIASGIERLVKMVLASECGSQGKAPEVLLIAPAVLHPDTSFVEFLPDGYRKSLRLAPLLRHTAASLGIRFLDGSAHAVVDAAEGLHLTRESHRRLAEAAAEIIYEF